MHRSAEAPDPPASYPDLLGWLALSWAFVFGSLYVATILRDRAPGLLATVLRVMLGG